MKRIRLGVFLVLLCSALMLCGSVQVLAAETLTVWVRGIEDNLKDYRLVAAAFEEQNPGVKVVIDSIPGSNQAQNMEKLLLAIIGGSPPDLMWMEGSAVIEFASQNLLLDLTDTLKGMRFAPADTQEMTFNGCMWAVPTFTTVRGLFKRVDTFEQAGMDPNSDPASLEALFDWNKKLTQVDGSGIYHQVGFIPWVGGWGAAAWMWAFGGDLVNMQQGIIQPTATNTNNVRALEWVRTWAQFYGTNPIAGSRPGFINGNIAMLAESSSAVGGFFDAGVSFTTGRVPHAPGSNNGTWGGGQAIAVPVNAPNPELSKKLVRFFGEAETQSATFNLASKRLPANWDALLTEGRKLPTEWHPLLDQLPEARGRTPLWIEYVGLLNQGMTAVINATKTPQQALSDVQLTMEVRYQEVFAQQ